MMQVNIHQEEDIISNHLAASLQNKKLVDFYQAYQLMDDEWKVVSNDLEVIQAEGFDVIKAIKPKMVSKKDKNNNPIEVQDGYMGYILPFELIQEVKLQDLKQQQVALEQKVQDIDARIDELTGEITEEDKETYSNLFAEDTGKLIDKEVKSVLKEFSKVASNDPEGFEAKIVEISTLGVEKKEVAKQSKALAEELVKQTIAIYDTLSDADARELITIKWVTPVIKSLESLPTTILETYADNLKKLGEKYQNTLMDIENDIREVSNTLISLIDELDANEEDKKGLEEFKKLLLMN
ncbi:hypothetical protein [Mycoplasma sp. BRA290]|uniref:hypothetical protein n=1 Tax=Mycoplasma sp. BRA290 TaxID=3401675 RepID=UPI003AACF287